MKVTINQMITLFELLPDSSNLPHGATHTFNMADPTGTIPTSFYSGQNYVTFTWSSTLKDWSFLIAGNKKP